MDAPLGRVGLELVLVLVGHVMVDIILVVLVVLHFRGLSSCSLLEALGPFLLVLLVLLICFPDEFLQFVILVAFISWGIFAAAGPLSAVISVLIPLE